MKTALITGTRAPAALDLARLFAAAGWRVIGADSLRFPVGRWSRALERHYHLLPAKADHHAYAAQLAAIIRDEGVDLLIPTCEEVFFIARHRDALSRLCRVACPDFTTLARLHDKTALAAAATGLGIAVPETIRVEDRDGLYRALGHLGRNVVLKPAFSRFACRTLIRPEAPAVARVCPSASDPWAVQRFVPGREVCTYAIAQAGRLTAFAAYEPRHRVGTGASILFQPVNEPEAEAFAAGFARRHALDGQFAFDLIHSPAQGWSVIECNPRATSGIHLFRPGDGLPDAFAGNGRHQPGDSCGRMVGLAMLLFGLPRAAMTGCLTEAWRDWRQAEDVMARPGDPWPAVTQGLALAEGLVRAVRLGCSPLAATTADLEWNGETL
ncbi:conserved hypothetical protein [Candidatus Terasakiella magnetica]|nr:conserved hypothetical protein [Candidatus Terasakiella magnetica]